MDYIVRQTNIGEVIDQDRTTAIPQAGSATSETVCASGGIGPPGIAAWWMERIASILLA